MNIMRFVIAISFISAVSSACGPQRSDERSDSEEPVPGPVVTPGDQPDGGQDTPPGPVDPVDDTYRDPWKLRARTKIRIGTDPTALRSLTGTSNQSQPITATVAAAVTFVVSTANFTTPAPDGVASYGTLDVTTLRDNNLRTCGAGGNQKCTQGLIRIYTTGTPGAGLWNTVEGYGLPILSGATTVGLDPAGAHGASSTSIGSQRVLQLSHFTGGGPLQIPVSVDFSDAAAGSYSSTLIVEYLVQ